MGSYLSNQMDPGNLCSIKTFEENENEVLNTKINTKGEDERIDSCNNINPDNHEHNVSCNEKEGQNIYDESVKDDLNDKKHKKSFEQDNLKNDCDTNLRSGSIINADEEVIIKKESLDEKNRKRRHSLESTGSDDCKKRIISVQESNEEDKHSNNDEEKSYNSENPWDECTDTNAKDCYGNNFVLCRSLFSLTLKKN